MHDCNNTAIMLPKYALPIQMKKFNTACFNYANLATFILQLCCVVAWSHVKLPYNAITMLLCSMTGIPAGLFLQLLSCPNEADLLTESKSPQKPLYKGLSHFLNTNSLRLND